MPASSEQRFPCALTSHTLAPVRMSQLSHHTSATTRRRMADSGPDCADTFRRGLHPAPRAN